MMVGSLNWRSSVSTTTISSRQFNQDAGGAKKAAEKGPVIITDRGRPAHVLLSFEDYQKLLGAGPSLLEALAQKEDGDFDFDPPRMGDDISRPVDLG
jgi:prevent-host-death family protein